MGERACSHSVHVLPRLPDEEEEGRRQGARGAHACCWKSGKGAVHDENVSATAAAEKEKAQIRQKDVKISFQAPRLSSSSAADTSAAAVVAPDSTAVTSAGMVSATHVKSMPPPHTIGHRCPVQDIVYGASKATA